MNTSILMVIPTLGQRPDWLRAALQSVLAQEGEFELTVRVVAPSTAELSDLSTDLRVHVMRSDRRGLAAAINDGWLDSDEFTYLAWLGDDDLLAPSALRRCVERLEAAPRASAVFGSVRYISGDGSTRWVQRPGPLAVPYFYVGKNLIPQQGSVFRSSFVRVVGGLDEKYRSAMDQDLFARLREVGALLRLREEVGAFRLHESNITVTKGVEGVDEGDAIRSRYVGSFYRYIRPVTELTDRVIYWFIRHSSHSEAPALNGRPYVRPLA